MKKTFGNLVSYRTVILILFFMFAGPLLLHGDVFSLWPFSGKGSLSAGNPSLLEGVDLWKEDISINGRQLDLNITLIERPLEEVLLGLRRHYKNFSALAGNSNSLLFEITLPSGNRKRHYLTAVAGTQSMLLFSMVLPKQFDSRNRSRLWPGELVLPPGAVPGTVMSFPKRGALYGQFTSPFNAREVIAQMNTQLRSGRWKPVADENNRLASGGLFLQDDAKKILIFSVKDQNAASGKSGCAGTVYVRKLESVSSHF